MDDCTVENYWPAWGLSNSECVCSNDLFLCVKRYSVTTWASVSTTAAAMQQVTRQEGQRTLEIVCREWGLEYFLQFITIHTAILCAALRNAILFSLDSDNGRSTMRD